MTNHERTEREGGYRLNMGVISFFFYKTTWFFIVPGAKHKNMEIHGLKSHP